MPEFDVVIIGAGTAGLTAARLLSRAGKSVALVERDRPGGDCLWTGCVPTKSLLEVARVMHEAQHSERLGVRVESARLDWEAVRGHVAEAQRVSGRADGEATIASWGASLIRGEAKFTSPDRINVDGRTLTAGAFVVATGSEVTVPPIPGLAGAGFDTNVEAVDWAGLPASLAIIGGGPVGVEFAQMCARLGVRTTLLEASAMLLPAEDPDASAVVERVLRNEGVDVRTGANITSVEAPGEHRILWTDAGPLEVSRILVATGRRPRVEGLELEAAGVRVANGRVKVDRRLRTSRPNIYVAGDASGAPQFTHVAEAQGRLVANILLGKRFQSWHGAIVPRVTYTDPEVASVGLPEAEASKRYRGATTWRIGLDEVDRAVTMGRTDGFFKVTTAPGWNRYIPGLRGLIGDPIVGATLVAPNAGDLLMPIVMAMRARLPQGIVAWNMQAYPTMALGLRQALGKRFDS